MFFKISEKIVDSFVNDGIVKDDDRELYQYGVRQGFSLILNIVTTLIIGLLLNMVWQSAMFMLYYAPIRIYAGGYHAKTQLRCYVLSSIMVTIVLLAIKYFTFTDITCVVLLAISDLVIFLFSPTEDKNKPLDELEKKVYRKRTLVILTVDSVLICEFIFLKFFDVAICGVLALLALSVMLIVARKKI